jgi:Domain of unknown function (DUF4160)
MPTVLRIDGLRIVIYPNDHPPAHVHVLGPGWVVVVNLIEVTVRETIGCDEREARRVVRLVAGQRKLLMDAWRRFHG